MVRFQLTDFHSRRGSGAVEGMGYKVSIRGSAGLRGLRAGFKPWHLVLIVLVIMGTSQPKQSYSTKGLEPVKGICRKAGSFFDFKRGGKYND